MVLAPNHPAPREQSGRGFGWPDSPSWAGLGPSVGLYKSPPLMKITFLEICQSTYVLINSSSQVQNIYRSAHHRMPSWEANPLWFYDLLPVVGLLFLSFFMKRLKSGRKICPPPNQKKNHFWKGLASWHNYHKIIWGHNYWSFLFIKNNVYSILS